YWISKDRITISARGEQSHTRCRQAPAAKSHRPAREGHTRSDRRSPATKTNVVTPSGEKTASSRCFMRTILSSSRCAGLAGPPDTTVRLYATIWSQAYAAGETRRGLRSWVFDATLPPLSPLLSVLPARKACWYHS